MGADEADFGCEIQVRSLLQDSWGELSRTEIYASEVPVSPSIERRMVALSKLLARADKVADEIRSNLARPRRARRPVKGQALTASALAFLFKQRFGEDPPEYLIQSLLRQTEGLQLRSDGIELALNDSAFLTRLEDAYMRASKWGEVFPYHLFRWALRSLQIGKDAAIRLAGREGRADRKEIETIATQEALANAPNLDEMLAAIERPDKDGDIDWDIESWAMGLGVVRECVYCEERIIDPEEFANAAIRYFKVRGKRADTLRERLADAVRDRSAEQGSFDDPSICSSCAYRLSKD